MGSPGRLEMVAAVFDQPTSLGAFDEVIAPGAFTEALNGDLTLLVANREHDPGRLLGRHTSGTLTVRQQAGVGLRCTVDLPDTELGRETAELVQRRDLAGASFMFVVTADSWREQPDSGRLLRVIESVGQIFDVTVCTWPAFRQTSTWMRSTPLVDARHEHLLNLTLTSGVLWRDSRPIAPPAFARRLHGQKRRFGCRHPSL